MVCTRRVFTEGWAYESPPSEMAGMLHPGAERLVLFHIVAAGRCWVALEDGSGTGPAGAT